MTGGAPMRAVAFVALAGFGALHWMGLVEPAQPGRAWAALAVATAVVLALLAAGRLAGRARHALAGASVLAGLALAVLAGGVGDELLAPARWDELVAGIGRGVGSLPGARVPYRGLDEWIRLTITVGGTVLLVLAAALAFWPRRARLGNPASALIVLVALYATPAIALDADAEFARGAALAVLVVAFLRLERVRFSDSRAAVVLAGGAAAAALAAAPLLDSEQPWWDYETWALSASSSRTTSFEWEHDYGPIDWPRDGREVLRVRAAAGTYWKADALDGYDGTRWVRLPLATNEADTAQIPAPRDVVRRWTQRIRVSVRNMRSRTFVTAGTPVAIRMPRRIVAPTGVAGIYSTIRTLRRGEAYEADVYTPRPNARQLRQAGVAYESFLSEYLRFTVLLAGNRNVGSAASYTLEPPLYGSDQPSAFVSRNGDLGDVALQGTQAVLERSNVRRTWALAQELAADSDTPYDLVRAVLAHLREGFSYTEDPPPAARSLEGFLFDARTGFCQQYSGAMALILRMAGVPARVATGFSPGSYDEDAGEYVVRDLDAHSWVEVWFPEIGWVPFDPTPSAAPARRQADSDSEATAAVGDVDDLAAGDTRTSQTDEGSGVAGAGGGRPWWLLALPPLGAGLAWLVVRRARRPRLSAVAELERALRRAGRPAPAGTTLRALEATLPGGYVRALRRARYGGAAAGPDRRDRRSLRAELRRGAGPLGALRAWWALPPRRGTLE